MGQEYHYSSIGSHTYRKSNVAKLVKMNLQKHIDCIIEQGNSEKCNKEWFACCQEIVKTGDFDIIVRMLSPFYMAYLSCLSCLRQDQGCAMQDAIVLQE